MSTTIRTIAFGVLACSAVLGQAISTSQINGTVEDASGLAIQGAQIRITQTNTGLTRTVTTSETGAYIVTSLPVGPYELQASKAGFSTYLQPGIVLQVNSNPEINVIMKVGSVTEQVVVQAEAAMVETHESGVGQVIDQARVVDLPLNGRQATDLIFLAGAATSAPAGDLNTNKNFPTQTISVSGGLPNGITYVMDGATNNDPFNNLNLPFPFPDALQEFKVETSAVPAQYGQHASAAVNVVTKSGGNSFHGDAFEFLRNGVFNARDFFAVKRDSLKRNQFGGTFGGPIIKDRLFFFAGYQGTITKSDPPSSISYVATQAMLNGDFSAVASAACNGGRTLTGGFVNNQIAPTKLNATALNFLSHVPVSTDPCGKLTYGVLNNNNEHQGLMHVDYQINQSNRLMARFFGANYSNPVVSTPNVLQVGSKAGQTNLSMSAAISDTTLISSNIVNAVRVTVNRTKNNRVLPAFFSPAELGAQVYSPIAGFMGVTVTGNGFTVGAGGVNPGYFNSLLYEAGDDLTFIKGAHQMAFGFNFQHGIMNSNNNRPTNGQFTFNGSSTGLSIADFMTGAVSGGFVQGNSVYDNDRANFIGAYGQDTWKVSRHLTLNLGVRWEPFLPEHNANKYNSHFDLSQFLAGTKSSVYANAPAGLSFPGDPGFSGQSNTNSAYMHFEPRVAAIIDPKGDGSMSIRASYGIFYDTPQLFFFTRFANNPPWGAQISLSNPAGGFSNPYLGYPGGNPFPGLANINKNSIFPLAGVYVNLPANTHAPYLQQYSLSIQKQISSNLLISGSYLGNKATHFWTGVEANPAVYIPGASTTGNTNARRVLNRLNPAQGQYFATIGQLDDGGTETYNGLLLSANKRMSRNFSVLANYTWSHCVSDPETTELTGPSYLNPNNRRMDRGNCSSDRRHVFNVSGIAMTPKFNNHLLRALASDWQYTLIVRAQTGGFSTVTTGTDTSLSGIGLARANQVLANPYGSPSSVTNYLNRLAFAAPAAGTFGNLGTFTIQNPGMLQIDTGLSRIFPVRESQTIQFRWEVFNMPNRLNPAAPISALNAGAFGQIQSDINGSGSQAGDPRIMQFALKYVF